MQANLEPAASIISTKLIFQSAHLGKRDEKLPCHGDEKIILADSGVNSKVSLDLY